jgi:hypothetical protein
VYYTRRKSSVASRERERKGKRERKRSDNRRGRFSFGEKLRRDGTREAKRVRGKKKSDFRACARDRIRLDLLNQSQSICLVFLIFIHISRERAANRWILAMEMTRAGFGDTRTPINVPRRCRHHRSPRAPRAEKLHGTNTSGDSLPSLLVIRRVYYFHAYLSARFTISNTRGFPGRTAVKLARQARSFPLRFDE